MRSSFRTTLLLTVAVPLGLPAADPRPRAPSAARVVNRDAARRQLGLLPYYPTVPGVKDVKVAVLDSGFDGVDGKRPYLPASAVVVEHYDAEFVKKFGLGGDAYLFVRNSHYSAPGFHDIHQKNTRVRVYLALNTAR